MPRLNVHAELEELCLQMLEKSPDKRPATMREVANRLQTWLEQTTPAARPSQPASAPGNAGRPSWAQ